MSVTDKELTFDFVENYKRKHQKVPRPDLREMLMLKLKISQRSSEARRLDHYLKKLFDTDLQQLKIIEELKNKVYDLKSYEWVEKYLHLSELLETDEDYQMLYDLIEKLDRKKEQEAQEQGYKENAEITAKYPLSKKPDTKEIEQDKKS